MLTLRLFILITCALCITLPVTAQVVVENGSTYVMGLDDLPKRGTAQSTVKKTFGEPLNIIPPVGKPPIERWEYEQFNVYFERGKVIHTVLMKNTDGAIPVLGSGTPMTSRADEIALPDGSPLLDKPAENRITPDQVKSLIRKMETEIRKRDSIALMEFFTPSASLTIQAKIGNEVKDLTMDTRTYRANLDASWAGVTQYVYSKQNETIDISPDGSTAKVTFDLHEELTIGGESTASNTKQTMLLEKIGNSLLITSLSATLR